MATLIATILIMNVAISLASCALTAIALLATSAVQAEAESEYKLAPPVSEGVPEAARSAVRLPLYAPLAAKTASRLPVEVREERGFLKAAAAAARFQAEAGKLALSKSSSPRVREYATEAIARHKATAHEFAHLLHVRGLAMPMLDNGHRLRLKNLARLGGGKFDRDYLEYALKYAREDIRQYEKSGLASNDPSLRRWVDRQLPGMRAGVMLAERVASPPASHARTPKPVAVTQPVMARPSESNSR